MVGYANDDLPAVRATPPLAHVVGLDLFGILGV
jgi:hypothetical protein